MPADTAILDPTAVTFADDEIFEFTPVIRDILRTRYCVPGSIFLVEGVDVKPVSSSGRWQAIRLLLGDGVLCIQALLSGDMHRLVNAGEVALGSYIRCESFEIKWQTVGHDTMVYLEIDDMVPVGWNDSYRALQEQQAKPEDAKKDHLETKQDEDDLSDEEAFEAFEILTCPPPRTKPPQLKKESSFLSKSQPIALPRDWHDHQSPLKLTTLRSIPHLPYVQNWSCNILAIVISLSPVEKSNLPPYKQRTARLADPSTTKRVHLTVFLDPDEFAPAIGSAVLLVGVKNHRFDGGSLKKYASDNKQGRWWFENPVDLTWCDVQGIKDWWAEIEKGSEE